MVSDTSLNVAGKVLYIIYILYIGLYFIYRAFQVVLVVKNPPANARRHKRHRFSL